MRVKSDFEKAARLTKIKIILAAQALLFLLAGQNFAVAKESSSSLLINTKKPVDSVEIINVYPHDLGAFTQGLLYHRGYLYESTGLNGKSSLRKVDLKTGKIVKQINLSDEYFAEGITLYEGRIYQLTWQNQKAFVYESNTFKKIQTINYKGEGWGIATDSRNLFMSDGSATIVRRDPVSFNVNRILNVSDDNKTIQGINELECVRGEIWANIFMEDVIARISPSTGNVIGWIDLAPLYAVVENRSGVDVLNGIAYDKIKDRIFVTGKYWPYLFEIKIKKSR